MKLHATITNDNGTKVSKGGHDRLTIGLNVGNKNIATVELTEKDIRIWYEGNHYWSTDIEQTGTKQQDECPTCEDGLNRFGWCPTCKKDE